MGSYSVDQCIRCSMGQLLYLSVADAGLWRERGYGDGSTLYADSAVLPCFHGCPVFLTGISHYDLLPHIPLIRLSVVNSSLHPGIAPQSLNSSSQPLCCLGYVWLWKDCLIFIPIRLHRSAVSPSALNVSPLTQTIA